jgi:glycosyltransferase involved in cell wall biosynthesis
MPVMMENPLVSIIIITYNDRKYVSEAIESALAQTYPNCEVIVVDDGSVDGTGEFISEHFGNRVCYRWKENGGMGSARHAGLLMANGKYIQHLDSDDLLLTDKIATQAEYLEAHPEIAFVYGRALCFFVDDRAVTCEHPANVRARSGNVLDDYIRDGGFINIGQPLTRRDWIDRIGGWDLLARGCDDQDIMLRLAYAGAEGHFLDRPVYMYRHTRNTHNPSQMMARHNLVERSESEIYIWEKLRSVMHRDLHPSRELATKRVGNLHFQLGRLLFSLGKRRSALNHLWRGVEFNRERWPYKLVILTAAFFLPGQQLLKWKNHLKDAFQRLKEES